jgi:hypothetical protein
VQTIIVNRARRKRGQLNVPATAKPRAEPTRTGEALAARNFGLEARNRVINFDRLVSDFIF